MPLYIPCDQFTVKHYDGMWNTSKKESKTWEKNIKRSAVRSIQNEVKIAGSVVSVQRVLDTLQIIQFRR